MTSREKNKNIIAKTKKILNKIKISRMLSESQEILLKFNAMSMADGISVDIQREAVRAAAVMVLYNEDNYSDEYKFMVNLYPKTLIDDPNFLNSPEIETICKDVNEELKKLKGPKDGKEI